MFVANSTIIHVHIHDLTGISLNVGGILLHREISFVGTKTVLPKNVFS